MQVYVLEQWRYPLYSLLGGIIIGMIYDFLCTFPFALSKERKHNFFGDTLFAVAVALITAVLAYSVNGGIYRVYPFLLSIASFGIYKAGISKVVLSIYLSIFNKIRAFRDYLFYKFKLVLDFFVKFVKMIMVNYIIKSYI